MLTEPARRIRLMGIDPLAERLFRLRLSSADPQELALWNPILTGQIDLIL